MVIVIIVGVILLAPFFLSPFCLSFFCFLFLGLNYHIYYCSSGLGLLGLKKNNTNIEKHKSLGYLVEEKRKPAKNFNLKLKLKQTKMWNILVKTGCL